MEGRIDDQNMELKKVHKSNAEVTVNNLFSCGKKKSAERVVLKALRSLKAKSGVNASNALKVSVDNACPLVELKSKKVGGISYRIPVHIFESKRSTLGIKWLVSSSCGRKIGDRFSTFSSELNNAYNSKGLTIQRKKALHNLAIANRAYIKFL